MMKRSSFSMTNFSGARRSAMHHVLMTTLLFLITFLTHPSHCHTVDVPSGAVLCFFEDLHLEDQMTITFQVAGGGHLDIDFWFDDPHGVHLWSVEKRDTGTFSFTAHTDGKHEYCFSNKMSTVTSKTVSFNVHGVMYVEDDGHTAPIETEIKNLAHALEAVKEEQEYIVVREKLHRNSGSRPAARLRLKLADRVLIQQPPNQPMTA